MWLACMAGGMAPQTFRVASIMALGGGAAYRPDRPGCDALRRTIGAGFDVVAQDRRPLRVHVTVQNEVTREEVAAALRASFTPWARQGIALRL